MINVSSWSIKNPIPAVMLFVMLCFAGMVSFGSMKVQACLKKMGHGSKA
jgi:multidrug efflux pump subunit AcrB